MSDSLQPHGRTRPSVYGILQAKTLAAAAAKSLQLCPTLCDPIDSSPPGSPVPGIFQARTLEWVAISFSNAWKWKNKVKSLSCVRLLATPWTAAHQAPPSMGFSRKSTGVGCHCSGLLFPFPGVFNSMWLKNIWPETKILSETFIWQASIVMIVSLQFKLIYKQKKQFSNASIENSFLSGDTFDYLCFMWNFSLEIYRIKTKTIT